MKDLFTYNAIREYLKGYVTSVRFLLKSYSIPLSEIICDHLGCLCHNPREFDEITEILLQFSKEIKSIELHNRRVKVFKFNKPLSSIFWIPKIEIVEPRPDAEPKSLRFGVEHISFYIPKWEEFIIKYKKQLPIIKEGSVNTSKFLKTEVINGVEIEFRSDKLGEES